MFDFGQHQQGGQPRYLNRKHSRLVIQENISPDEFFRAEKETLVDPNGGLITTEVQSVYVMDCGDTILSPSEIGPSCQCGKTLCRMCSSVRCGICLLVYCPWCLHLLENIPHCGSCKIKEQMKNGIIGFFRGLHHLLDKEF